MTRARPKRQKWPASAPVFELAAGRCPKHGYRAITVEGTFMTDCDNGSVLAIYCACDEPDEWQWERLGVLRPLTPAAADLLRLVSRG